MSETAQLVEKEIQKEEVPSMYIEVVAKGQSGYTLDGTAGTPHEQSINCAEITFIPNTGKMAEPILNAGGKPTGNFRNVEIRYIKDCPTIRVDEQRKLGYEKSSIATNDSIAIKKGNALIKREGDVSFYDYLYFVYYNETAPNRPRSAKVLYRIVEVEKNVSRFNEDRFLQAKAISTVETLVLRVGKGYKFKENKIDNLLTALELFGGDNYSDKIRVLTDYAEKQPKDFLDIASKLDNITITEVTHAIELNVIGFEGNTAQYVETKTVVGIVNSEAKITAKKIEALAELLKTPEYAQAYTELKAKLEIAQEKIFKA